MELLSLVEDIHVETLETSQNTDLDVLTYWAPKRDNKKAKKVEDDPLTLKTKGSCREMD